MQALCGFIISAGCALCGFINTNSYIDFVGLYSGDPLSMMKGNALELAIPLPTVCHILMTGYLAKILSPIIKRVMISMVRLLRRIAGENEPMHWNCLKDAAYSLAPGCIKTLCAWAPMSVPCPSVQPLKVSSIHNSVLPLRKWDVPVRFIEWLGNGMPFHVSAFRHGSSSKGLMLPSHFSINGTVKRGSFCTVW